MKPNFALTLSFDGIGLLHRTHAGWHLVGEVALSSDDLTADLAELSAKARTLDPTGLRTKLVLPDEQIKYLSLDTSARDVNTIEAEVRDALDGATPYALRDLSYDWSVRNGRVHVAAVARETLAEAESFAQEHALNPLCFVAMPAEDAFAGEPFFGETAYAGKVLGPDESVDRENEVIHIVGAARLPEPEPVPASADPVEPEAAEPAPEPTPEPEPKPEPEPEPEPEAKPEPAPKTDAKPAPNEKTQPETAPEPAQKAKGGGGRNRKNRKNRKGQQAGQPDQPPKPAAAKDQPAPDTPEEAATPPADAPETPKKADAPVAFTSIRTAPRHDPGKASPAGDNRTAELPKARFTPPPDAPAASDKPKKPTPAKVPGPPPEALAAVPAPEPENEFGTPPKEEDYTGPPPASLTPEASEGEGKSALGGFLSRRKKPAAPPKEKPAAKRQEVSAAEASLTPTAAASLDEKDRMTIFGARRTENIQPEKPRYMALILTAILLLFLVGVAAWAALFLDDGVAGLFRSSDEVQTAEDTTPDAAIDEAVSSALTDQPEAEDTPAEIETAALPDDPASEDPGNPDAQIEVMEEPPPTPRPELVPEELTPDEARARYAATGIWQLAPEPSQAPGVTTLEDVYQTNLDPDVNFSDAVALPDAEELTPGARPATPSDPPPPGARFELDERGFIAATPEGTETPEGVTIFAGPPPILPPETPPRAEVEVLDGPAAAAPEDPTIRPRARPGDLQETRERSILGGRTLTELASFRPRQRPKSPQQEALEELAEETGTDPDSDDPMATATEQAVAVSLKPTTRPNGFKAIVAEARQAAASEPVSQEQRVAVNIPTSTSVARAATDKNQISLRKVNLIGVYGKPNGRRALVRMANGSYRKVQVGDRLDGGQVAAIGESELRYVKGGRSVVLKMPKG